MTVPSESDKVRKEGARERGEGENRDKWDKGEREFRGIEIGRRKGKEVKRKGPISPIKRVRAIKESRKIGIR